MPGGVTHFTLWTRDAWSLRDNLRFAEAGTSRLSVSEVNVLGTGRAIAVAGRTSRDATRSPCRSTIRTWPTRESAPLR